MNKYEAKIDIEEYCAGAVGGLTKLIPVAYELKLEKHLTAVKNALKAFMDDAIKIEVSAEEMIESFMAAHTPEAIAARTRKL